jgi:hypothetical protein
MKSVAPSEVESLTPAATVAFSVMFALQPNGVRRLFGSMPAFAQPATAWPLNPDGPRRSLLGGDGEGEARKAARPSVRSVRPGERRRGR